MQFFDKVKMNSKIKKSFQNSRFYRNYNNIDQIVLKFEKINNEYIESKNKYKNFHDKFELNDIYHNKINVDKHLYSMRKILNEKINISCSIKKYVKYSESINDDFIKSVKIGDIKNINILLENGANINFKDDYAIRLASMNGNIELFKFLEQNGANIYINNGCVLKLSSKYGHLELVKYIYECDNYFSYCIDYALIHASKKGHIDIVKFLVINGALLREDHVHTFKKSIKNGHIEVVKFLISSDLGFFINDDSIKNIVIEHKLIDFYKFFDIE